MKLPFLRGLTGLWDALIIGVRFLTISANTQTGEDEKIEGWPLYSDAGFLPRNRYRVVLPASRRSWTACRILSALELFLGERPRRPAAPGPPGRIYLGYWFHAGYQAGLPISRRRA